MCTQQEADSVILSLDMVGWCQECERCQCAKGVQPIPGSFMGHLLDAQPNEILVLDFSVGALKFQS